MIPVCEPLLTGKELAYVEECLRTNWISSKGRFITEFEEQFASYCGAKHGIATTSGTSALHLALATLGIGRGDEVIVPVFTMAACIFAVLYTGATPVLVDADPDTWTMDVGQIESKVTPRTRAIMPVHIYGHPCDMDPIVEVAERHGLYIVEDAAEAHGAEYRGRKVGSLGHVGCFSFYANKIITTGEGGMVVTNDDRAADLARRLRDQAYSPEKRFLHTHIGFNYRMTNVQAAIGLGQLEHIDQFVAARRRNACRYNQVLKGIPGVTLPAEKPWAKNVYWMYGILVDEAEFGMSRDALMAALAEKGVETRPFFYPMHRQPAFVNIGLFHGEEYPVADMLAEKGVYLPSGSGLSTAQIKQVCQAIEEVRTQRVRP
jgi:perosamine synthetase